MRFHFKIQDGAEVPDSVGAELAGMNEARREAVRLMGELMRDNPDAVWGDEAWRMVVTDDADLTLFTIEVLTSYAPAGRARSLG